jgi:hypothetical protein
MSINDDNSKKPYPSKMEDGRAFTDYRPRCSVNADLYNDLTKNNLINSSYESRLYLQNNAEKIMQSDRDKALAELKPCNPPKSTMLPEKYIVKCDSVSCKRTEIDPSGLGDGRNY